VRSIRHTPAADIDLLDSASWYPAETGERFLDAVEKLEASIRTRPALGTLCGFNDIRFRLIAGFPHAIFYRHSDDHVVVTRVLHHIRDIDSLLATDSG
jgi:plasmid stabilization system protein ParE